MSFAAPPSREALLKQAVKRYRQIFDQDPHFGASCPASTRIFGDDCARDEGTALGMTVQLYTTIVGRPNNTTDGRIFVLSGVERLDQTYVRIRLPSNAGILYKAPPMWSHPFRGVISNFHAPLTGFDCIVFSNIPVGHGLGSRAADVVAFFTFLESLIGDYLPAREKVSRLSMAMTYVNDTYLTIDHILFCVHGMQHHLMLVDCSSCRDVLQIPLSNEFVFFYIIIYTLLEPNEEVKQTRIRRMADLQRAQNRIGPLRLINENNLADLQRSGEIDGDEFKRARYLVSEIARANLATELILTRDYASFGFQMYQSQQSYNVEFEIMTAVEEELVKYLVMEDAVAGYRVKSYHRGGSFLAMIERDFYINFLNWMDISLDVFNYDQYRFAILPPDGVQVVDITCWDI